MPAGTCGATTPAVPGVITVGRATGPPTARARDATSRTTSAGVALSGESVSLETRLRRPCTQQMAAAEVADLRRGRRLSDFPATGRCIECDADLSGRRKGTKYCNEDCRVKWYARHDYATLVWVILERDKHICQLCGYSQRSRAHRASQGYQGLEVDHIVPISDGGDVFDQDNCRTLCEDCHRKVTANWRREKALERVQGWAMPLRGRTAELVAGQTELPGFEDGR